MASISGFYINSSSFATATSIYTDAALTTFAADGFYKDCGIVRELSSGVLGDPVLCPSCGAACDATYTMPSQGVYTTDVVLGGTTGVASVLFNPGANPAAIYVNYNGTVYSSGVQGNGSVLDGPYFGDTGEDCGLVANSPHTLTTYDYNVLTSSYDTTGSTLVTITSDELSLTAGDPGTLFIVFAYNDSTVSQATITVVNACKDSSSNFIINCGDRAERYQSSEVAVDPAAACALNITTGRYLVARDGVSVEPSTGDVMFKDAACRKPMDDGFYSGTIGGVKKSFEIADGAVQTIANCSAP